MEAVDCPLPVPAPGSYLCWADCWPQHVAVATPWSACVAPGLTALIDVSGDEARHWLPLLAGQVPRAQGALGWRAAVATEPASWQPLLPEMVAWWPAHAQPPDPRQHVRDWVQGWRRRWPGWDAQAWQAHLEGFALQAQCDKPVAHLSTGTWRKLGLAATLACGAPLALIDAPTAGLDQASVRYLAQALQAVGQDIACGAQPPRWVLVAHWAPLPGVDWSQVLALPPCDAGPG